ncbi:MAG: hypothetical protein LQ342_005985 [Letrouitia transgressa]|nr:MAG: hypothetical protein LQ342_005985 [Letrouitia transgressa]
MANPRQHYELFGQPEPESGDPNTIFNGKSEVQIARGVVRKTSIKVSSEPLETENVGSSSSYAFAIVGGPPKNPIRKRIVKYRGKNGGGKRDSSSESSSHLRQDLKGLERAADLKRWAGMGKPGEAWGKLKKDPELWDPQGDTLVYFGRQRSEPSFRIHSSLLRDTESLILLRDLEEGRINPLDRPQSVLSGSSGSSRFRRLGRLHRQETSSEAETLVDEVSIQHCVYFDAPPSCDQMDMLRYHVTTRNFLALLLNKPIVGLTFYQAVVDLYGRLMALLLPDTDCEGLLIEYLVVNGLVDVRNDPGAAAGLLAWSEECTVRWQDGWREAFVHGVGMYDHISRLKEYQDITPITQTLLEQAHLEIGVRVQEAEARLSSFDYGYAWPRQRKRSDQAYLAFIRYAKFLKRHYETRFKAWPPKERSQSGDWLSRSLALQLQRDFGSLYDCFVDRGVTWHHQREGLKRKSTIADSQIDSSMAKFLLGIDREHARPNIPHPYPLLPVLPIEKQDSKAGLFASLKKSKTLQKRIESAYSKASNAVDSGYNYMDNSLVVSSVAFEKSDHHGEIDPADARRGRWMLIYCVLQTLTKVASDTPGIGYTEGVEYFLNPSLKGTPPWRLSAEPVYEEAKPESTYCWQAPLTWLCDPVSTDVETHVVRHKNTASVSTSSVVSGESIALSEAPQRVNSGNPRLKASLSKLSLKSDNSTAVSTTNSRHNQSIVSSKRQGTMKGLRTAFANEDRQTPIRVQAASTT